MKNKWEEYGKFTIKKNGTNINGDMMHEIVEEEKLKQSETCSVYRIRIINVKLPRLLKSDSDGILAIGKTKDLNKRYGQIKTGLTKWNEHSEAILVHYVYTYSECFWRKYISTKTMAVEYYMPKNSNIDNAEAVEMISYIKEYGEPPPFNSAIPRRYDDKIWNKVFNV